MATMTSGMVNPTRHIDIAAGTQEAVWQACGKLDHLPAIDLADLVPRKARAVILAPHPDDETLGCGGLISQLSARNHRISIVAVSDGEGSHPHNATLTAALPQQRAEESMAALQCLGAADLHILRVRVPDGAVSQHRLRLNAWLRAHLEPTDILFAPWRLDGHPDHEAVGHLAAAIAEDTGCKLIEVPIWAWHWALPDDARIPWGRAHRLNLTPAAEQKKRQALHCYHSQIHCDGDCPPVLPAQVLAHFIRPYEVFFL